MARASGFKAFYDQIQAVMEHAVNAEAQAQDDAKPHQLEVEESMPILSKTITKRREITVSEEETQTVLFPPKEEQKEYVKLLITIPRDTYRLLEEEVKVRKKFETPNPMIVALITEAIQSCYSNRIHTSIALRQSS